MERGPRDLNPGDVVYVDLGDRVGREQRGQRPAVVVASRDFLEKADQLALVAPLTTRARGWPNHRLVHGPSGLSRPSWAMTEQVTVIDRTRILRHTGRVASTCLADIRSWVVSFLLD